MNRQKASMRSHGSSSSSASDPHKHVKECCRKFIAFMCTQVGVGALIVVYAVVGAISFTAIETKRLDNSSIIVEELRKNCSFYLWKNTEELNLFNHTKWQDQSDVVLLDFQKEISKMIKDGYDGRTPYEIWKFVPALMYCLSVFTMIGYGNLVPRTPWGKGVTIIYATFGIPLYILYFLNMGKVLAQAFKFLYTMIHECTHEKPNINDSIEDGHNGDYDKDGGGSRGISGGGGDDEDLIKPKKIIVPSTACLWVIIFYVVAGTIMFKYWEKWDYLDAVYFCVTSLCKIGFGDFVPGGSIQPIMNAKTKNNNNTSLDINNNTNYNNISVATSFSISDEIDRDKQIKLAITFIYMLIGMGLVAMCYNLMREEVRVKLKEIKEDLRLCMEDVRSKFAGCCGNKDYYDDEYYYQ